MKRKAAGKFFLEKPDRIKHFLILAGCILLVAINILVFISLPRMMAPLAILLSNAVTMIITALSFQPLSRLMQDVLSRRQEELAAKALREHELEEKIQGLEIRNHELLQQLDTREQAENLPANINFTFKLEQMEFAKKGYIVKEEALERLDPARFSLPEASWWETLIGESGEKRILYIHKFYYKVAIGIDFSRIKYTWDAGKILFYGVKFSKLHDISSELVPDEQDIDRCDILKINGEKAEIKQDKAYGPLKKNYRQQQEREVREHLEAEADTLCRRYTEVFRDSICSRFPQIDFVESVDESPLDWYILSGSTDRQIIDIASNMLMLTSLIGKTQAIEESTLKQLEL